MPSKWITEASRIVVYYVREYGEWTSMLALTSGGQAVTVREYRHGADVSVPALPSGSVEDDDLTAEHAAERELLEETGYRAGRTIALGSAYANWANQNNRVHYFLSFDCKLAARPALDENEEIEVGLFPIDDVMRPGFLQQSFHLANLWLALPHLRERGLLDG